jgi:hypothetical protein
MALTYTVENTYTAGGRRRVNGTITFDSSYPTAGESFAPTSVGLVQLTDLTVWPGLINSATTGLMPVWNRSTTAPTVKVLDGTFAESANATNLATFTCGYEATGY